MAKIVTRNQLADYFDYLDNLRASGDTNMFGARPYLMREFNMEGELAARVLTHWMKCDLSTPVGERAEAALPLVNQAA